MWTLGQAWLLSGGCQDGAAEREEALVLAMDKLDDDVTGVRDAIIRGDLPDARARAGTVALALPSFPDPAAAEPMRLALAAVSGAASVPDAAIAFGRVLDQCAGCHARSDVVGRTRPVWTVPPTRPTEMARHAAQVDNLWLSLLHPSETELAATVTAIEQDASAPDATGIDLRVRDLAHAVRDTAPENRGAAFGSLLAACADCHTAGKQPAVPRIAGIPLPDLTVEMDDHFVHALELQLAIMGGELDRAHQAAEKLELMPEDIPAAGSFLASIRAAAGRAKRAGTLEEAGRATGEMALACGECHTATGGGPKDVPSPPPAEPHMALHVYGAYWMGFGLFAPDERAWKAGTSALASSKLMPEGGATTPPGMQDEEDAVHTLATKAATTTDPAGRAAIWGELLGACSPCHLRLPSR